MRMQQSQAMWPSMDSLPRLSDECCPDPFAVDPINPLSEALVESFAKVDSEFRAMVNEEVRRIVLSSETAAAVRKAITAAMHEEAQKIGRRLARQLAMQEPTT